MLKQFVFHHHTGYGQPHYDLMLEYSETLATWQLTIPLSEIQQEQKIIVKKIQDHRLIYLSYEGTISKGRGKIKKVDFGDYKLLINEISHCEFILYGQHSTAHYKLKKIDLDNNSWSLVKFQQSKR
ncbi:DNA polymerase ligase N-terminal domain-containing protein [Crocosphaera sp.]|uniref:DNA polymerase ligase N-terminal domain-containing protein n=1 Tax=Crocosphaera sp. TaxID=2729996 RepID=UPI0026337610|nr:DNA polymerase ligase N-terminal domain-containing protein [Crocosphaera sp.]MDJ0581883.1 DNA polymerase ligase N-terminal domain-containing protein [Crocosphaera sp.]